MRRHGHDRAGAVVGQHEVAEPDRDAVAGKGIEAVGSREHAVLFQGLGLAVEAVHVAGALDEGADLIFVLTAGNEGFHQRMLGSQRHEGHAEQCVGAGGEHLDFSLTPFEPERNLRTGGTAYPVVLHGEHAGGPALFQLLEVGQKLVGIGRDAEEPLREVLLLHLGVAAPALAVDDLFVGENGVAARAPVLRSLLAVDETLFKALQEKFLFPAIVFGTAGRNLPAPVVGVAHALKLRAHVVDVGVGPLCRMRSVLDGGVFRRQAEGVPADGMQDIVALKTAETRHDVAYGVVADVSHMNVARGIREHFHKKILGLGRIDIAVEGAFFSPYLLPLLFQRMRIVTRRKCHFCSLKTSGLRPLCI